VPEVRVPEWVSNEVTNAELLASVVDTPIVTRVASQASDERLVFAVRKPMTVARALWACAGVVRPVVSTVS
jgi:hypothetical protein